MKKADSRYPILNDYENARLIKQAERRIKRNWVPRRPWESTIAGLIGDDALESFMVSSAMHPVPVPIINIPQVQLYGGMLVPHIAGGAGFSSIGDMASEAAAGKLFGYNFAKTGVTGVAGINNTLWYEGTVPAAGSTMAALAGGTETTRTTTGALGQLNPATGGDLQFVVSANISASVINMGLMLIDRIWGGAIAASNNTTQTVTISGGINRYSGTGAGATSAGNFAFVEVQSALGATAHTWTLVYTDDQNNASNTAAALTGVSGAIAKRFDTTLPYWGIPLNSPDLGISDIASIANSASVTGTAVLVLAHALGFLAPCPVINTMFPIDFVAGQFNLARVYDDACLSFVETPKAATTATNYSGMINLLQG